MALDQGSFGIGDKVTFKCGSLAGIIHPISGDDALILWTFQGKSTVPVQDRQSFEHGG